jgi:hypothetical protein
MRALLSEVDILHDIDITAALEYGTSIALPQATAKVEEMKKKV